MTDTAAPPSSPTWHTLSPEDTAQALACSPATGLSANTAAERLAQHGENRLAEASPRSALLKFFDQFKSFLILVLLFAAALAWAIGDLKDAVVILVVTLFNACLGFYQEHRAERTLAALKGMLAVQTRVRRDGQTHDIDASQLVPGDIVLLEAGDRVPADGRALAVHGFEVDEAALTGESHAVGKAVDTLDEAELDLGDRANMLFMNTVVTRGRAEMIVTATGMNTEMGKLAGLIAETPDTKTPLQVQLDALGKRLAIIAGLVIAGILALSAWQGVEWTEALINAVALAVAAIPEGLPAVVTVTLAVGMWRMARNRAILKRLAAVETLGSTTVICSDKTGTLTLNQMTARAGWFAGHCFSVSGQGYTPEGELEGADPQTLHPYLLPMCLCTESSVRNGKLVGDPTEGALFVLAHKAGLDPCREQERQPRTAEIPFDSTHKFIATFHHRGDCVEMLIKGAPDAILDRCAHWLTESRPKPAVEIVRARIS